MLAGRPVLAQAPYLFQWKRWGERVWLYGTVRNMSGMRNSPLPPVILDRYEDFEEYARNAALVTYKPEFYKGPFLDDPERVRRVTFNAIGVNINGIVLSFMYKLSYDDMYDAALSWEDQAIAIENQIMDMVTHLQAECGLVQGSLESSPALGESLTLRL